MLQTRAIMGKENLTAGNPVTSDRCAEHSRQLGSGQVPDEVTIVDKSVSERIKLIQQLEEEDKKAIFRIIDGILTKTKFKDFFNKNVALF